MEETIITENQLPDETPDLTLTTEAQFYLQETAKWAKFLGVMGFVLCGFMALVAVFGSAVATFMQRLNPNANQMTSSGGFVSIIYIVMVLLYFFPSLYVYRFGVKAQKALLFSDTDELTDSFSNLKSLYKFWGIFTIVYLAFLALILVGVIIVVAFVASKR